MPLPDFSSETLKGELLELVTLTLWGRVKKQSQFLTEKGEVQSLEPKQAGRSVEPQTAPLPAVTFVFKRNKENVVLPHTTNTYFFSFEITLLSAHRNLRISWSAPGRTNIKLLFYLWARTDQISCLVLLDKHCLLKKLRFWRSDFIY